MTHSAHANKIADLHSLGSRRRRNRRCLWQALDPAQERRGNRGRLRPVLRACVLIERAPLKGATFSAGCRLTGSRAFAPFVRVGSMRRHDADAKPLRRTPPLLAADSATALHHDCPQR
jgi:hypothetical protein